MAEKGSSQFDIAVAGGGLVGTAVAWGLARLGQRVVVLDEGDDAIRASRGNFALVWVQSKGLGLPDYVGWTIASSDSWAEFAAMLKAETGLEVCFERPGGFTLALSMSELEQRAQLVQRLHNQSGGPGNRTEILGRADVLKMLPDIGPEVVGGSYCPLDGHVNSLRLFRALHQGLAQHGVSYRPGEPVLGITRRRGAFAIRTPAGEVEAGKVVLAAGNANMHLAPMVGLKAPMVPERGQIIVTERVRPFLRHPLVTIRQTDEGTVMIGDSREDGVTPDGLNRGINSVMASRAARMFPLLGRLNVVRTWRAIRVMTEDGFPIYEQSETHPGAFVITCHSGVTLAANHALRIAPMIAAGQLAPELAAFSSRRFDVPKVA